LAAPALAQDALRTAVAGDRLYDARQAKARAPIPDDQLQLGPVSFQVALSYGLEWNDNINYAPTDLEDDFIHRPQLNFHGIWPATKDSRLSFGLGVGYQHYMDHSDLDRMVLTPDSELAWDVKIKDLVLTLYDRVEYSQDVVSQGGLSGTAEFPRIENTAGARARWYPGRYGFELGYAHYNFFSESSEFDYLTRAAEQFFGRAGIRIGDASQVGLEASGALTDYDSETRPDNQNVSFGPYVDWQVIESLHLTARGGYTVFFNDPDPLTGLESELESYYLGLDVNHRLTDFITHGLTVSRDVQQGVNRGSTYTEQLRARYFVSWAMTRHVSLSADFFYEHGKEPQFGVVEEYDRLGSGAGVRWQATRYATVALNYRFTNKDSNFPTRDYQQNAVILTASYQF
jgi:hypothetical protein